MNKNNITFLFLILMALIPISVPAAELPTLPADSNIKAGKLGNGISYYIVANSRGTGKVDIALVQKVGRLDENKENAGETIVRARAAINELPHFTEMTPFRFMYGKYIWPGSEGYVKVTDDATIFRFPNITNSTGKESVDSTLLMVFDIIGKDNHVMKSIYVPENQAIIVAGDVDVQAVLGKMNMLSMLVVDKKAAQKPDKYEWKQTKGPEYAPRFSKDTLLASISIDYKLPRVPKESVGTVLPLVSSRYFSELGVLLRKRLARALRQEDIPVAGIDFNYRGSTSYSGDEHYIISVSASRSDLLEATRVLAGVLAELDVNGAAQGEYSDASNQVVVSIKRSGLYGEVPNEDYVEICTSAFLYGASMASPKTNLDFFTRRSLDEEASLKLFNNFVSAVLDKSVNLTLGCSSGDAVSLEDDIKKTFSDAWDSKAVKLPFSNHIVSHNDTTGFRPQGLKSKIRSVSSEPVSGGQMITFVNGIKVIYKRMPTSDKMFYYSWMVRGGYSQVPELSAAGADYLPDMLKMYNVAGMTSERFQDMLAANGITIDAEVSVADCFIRGAAPANRLPLLMKALSGLANDRSIDTKAFGYYRKCKSLVNRYSVGSKEHKAAVLDSILTHDNQSSDYMRVAEVRPDIQANAEKFYSKVFSKMNDGVLIITGDVDENVLKKVLSQYIAGFKTSRGSAYRSRIHNKNISGRVTVYKYGEKPSISIAMASPLNQTVENYMSGIIAGSALKDAVARAAVVYGWNIDADWHFSMFPEETFNINLYLSRASDEGLPASMMPSDSAEMVLSSVRKAIANAGAKGLDARHLTAGKAEIKGLFSIWKNNPAIMRSIIELRYAYGKDLMTGYDAKLNAVSAGSVNSILKSLSEGSTAEYVVRMKNVHSVNEAIMPVPVFPNVPQMRPVSDFTYPFEDMRVPLDSIDLKVLESQPMRYYEADSLMTRCTRISQDSLIIKGQPDSLGMKHITDTLMVKNQPDSLVIKNKPDTLVVKNIIETENAY